MTDRDILADARPAPIEESIEADAVPAEEGVPEAVRRRLAPAMPKDRLFAAIGTTVVVLIGGLLRLIGLGHPKGKIFDEIYYATEGDDLIRHGVEWNHTNNTGDFVVHPPLGKWLIGFGIWISERFGSLTPEFGWRIAPMLFGTGVIWMTVRITRRMFRSTMLGLAAGLLISLDGMEFVLSRSALLDIFLMFFVLAAFGCLVMDRDARRARWLRALDNGLDPTVPGRRGRPGGGFLGSIPWWRLAAGVMTGCAMAVKWSALWYILLFMALIFFWEVGIRRSAGAPHPWRDTLLDETGWIVVYGLVLVMVYLATWTGWFLSDHGYDRHYLAATGQTEYPIIGALENLWHYHWDALHFHFGLDAPHTYQSWPWQWLLLGRPVAFYYSPAGPCGAANCSAEVLLLGTPLLWWSFLPALVGVTGYAFARRDWRATAIVLCAAAGIVPWFPYEVDHRTMFYFYAAPAVPFLVMTVVYIFGAVIRGAKRPTWWSEYRRPVGAALLGAFLVIVAWCFLYFYPLYVGQRITYEAWYAHMWLGGRWI